ncbi:MAG: IS1634 family transposase [Verrucomicrobiae bacterium]|nr:IS1634 family transposase [Verrucomicrobiae bacterium]
MEKNESPPTEYDILKDAQFYAHNHLPLAAAYCRSLGLADLVDRMVPTRMQVRPGLVVQAMVLDTLSGRSPLYRLEEFMADQDIELLLGASVPASDFNDTNLARSLDAIFNVGCTKILTQIGVQATQKFSLDPSVVSYDTTSTSVWGDYRMCEGESHLEPSVTYGFSKDHRPDLKQFMTELLCVERGVPIFGHTLDGNSSDKTSNNRLLTRISSIMAKHGLGPGAFVYIADSAMVTEKNLKVIGDAHRFISRLPASYSACSKLITGAVNADQWIDLGRLAENHGSPNRPGASYKVYESSVELYGDTYRALVVHSDSHDKRRRKKLDKAIVQSKKDVDAQIKEFNTVYYCLPDAQEAAHKIAKCSSSLHNVETTVCPFQVRRRGRPPQNKPANLQTKFKVKWTIVEKSEDIEKIKEEAGCFVLISNVAVDGDEALSAEQVLRQYKGQYGVESNFAFLKDPLIVNDTFLKLPRRIDVLGMILVIALLIWRLMERSLRAWVKNTGQTLPGWDKKRTTKPTAFMVSTAFYGIQVFKKKDGHRFFLQEPSGRQNEYLQALGLSADVFISCRSTCKPIIPSESLSKR